MLGWRRTHKDPFEGEWEQILSWLVANPERSSGDIFRELQRRSPGRYQPLQIRTLQRGMRKIRVHLLQTLEEQWQEEVIRGPFPISVSVEGQPAYPDRAMDQIPWLDFNEAMHLNRCCGIEKKRASICYTKKGNLLDYRANVKCMTCPKKGDTFAYREAIPSNPLRNPPHQTLRLTHLAFDGGADGHAIDLVSLRSKYSNDPTLNHSVLWMHLA